MSYTIPDATAFKTRHPRFAAVSDGTVTLYIGEASRTVTERWSEDDYADGIMYLAAHLMVCEGAIAPTGVALGVGNQIKKTKAGEVEVEFATDDKGFGNGLVMRSYSSTIYGQRYLELSSRNVGVAGPAVMVV